MKTTHTFVTTALIVLGSLAAACSQAPTPVPTRVPVTATVPVPPTLTPVPIPSSTPVPPPAPTLVAPDPVPTAAAPVPQDGNCANRYAFVSDESIPDDTAVPAGQAFTKTWRLRNTGTCAWGEGYTLAWVKGEAMATATSIGVPATAPGETVDLSVPMTAPAQPGTYQGFWALKLPSGVALSPSLWVKIVVP